MIHSPSNAPAPDNIGCAEILKIAGDSERPTLSAWAGLVDAVGSMDQLPDAVVGAAEWWQTAVEASRAAVWVREPLRRRIVVGIAAAGIDATVRLQEECMSHGDAWSAAELAGRTGGPAPDGRLSLVRSGEEVGGILLWSRPRANEVGYAGAMQSAIELTARLLQQARGREERLWSAKLESLAEFAAGAGHEVNNPLATILGRVQLLQPGEIDPERRRILWTIGAQALRARDMIGDVMLFGRPPLPRPEPVVLATELEQVETRFQEEVEARSLQLVREHDPGLVVQADRTQLRVVWSELLRNAIHASPAGGVLRIQSRLVPGESAWVEFSLEDQGEGLSEVDRLHLFDPFYSGRQAGRGLGFGLSKCWRIVTNHAGCLHVDSTDGTGLKMVIHWPVGAAAADSAAGNGSRTH